MARGSAGRVGKSSGRGNSAIPPKMPIVPIPTTVSPQQGGTSSNICGLDRTNQVQILGPSSTPPVQMPNHNNIPTIVESSPITPNESNQIGEGASTQSSTIGEGESNNRGQRRTIVTLTATGLEPSSTCSTFIAKSFKNELDPNGINWKGVSQPVKDFYFGEFKKEFYWDSSTNENAVKRQWEIKASLRYRDFISRIKKNGTNPEYVADIVWENWMRLWQAPENVAKSETNKKIVVEEEKLLSELIQAIEKGRDPTPSELHLHVHTHDHDGKSFVDERAQIVHERYEEILREKIESESDNDQRDAYYQAADGEKKRRIYGLGIQIKSYYGPNLCISSQFDASSSIPPSVSQSAPMENMDEFVKKLIPTLTDHMIPILLERIQGVTYLPSHQSAHTPIGDASSATPMVPNKVVSDDDHISSP
ncbi:hypothetical protein KY290_034093 [Solanum tuberosum]|uniref:Transposon protein, CACTA, En/Spm sub-class n=1 Tax=Solanum tuberosum TaxID=4113 RepID=A0ABQ7U5Y2_SOLTU|nr:hypothetical protein KY289_034812 [Solanum tuberosum]KAH0741050.1 hypothetical protein KY290_034093 [Solanum tuberosum]